MLASAARVAVGLTFLLAGTLKLGDRTWSASARSLGVPASLVPLIGPAEVVLGALLVAGVGSDLVSWMALAVLVVLSVVLVVAVSKPIDVRPACACFGRWSSRPVGPWSLVRNAALIVAAVVSLAG